MKKYILFVATLALLFLPQAGATRELTFEDFFGTGRMADPQWSPNGSEIAFVITEYSLETNKGDSDIYIIPANGGEMRRLTNSPGRDSQPRF